MPRSTKAPKLSRDLQLAAESLRLRIEICGSMPSPTTVREDWTPLIQFYGETFPQEYVEMMLAYPFDFAVLEYACLNQVRQYPGSQYQDYIDAMFRFRGPLAAPSERSLSVGYDKDFKAFGLVGIGEGEDGDMWVVRADSGLAGPVFLIEHTAWGPGMPSFDNGMTCAAPSFAHLMAGFSIRHFVSGEFDFEQGRHEYEVNSHLFEYCPPDGPIYHLEPVQKG